MRVRVRETRMDKLITAISLIEVAAIVIVVWAVVRISGAFEEIARSLAEIAGILRKSS
jgi:hypothetical protein